MFLNYVKLALRNLRRNRLFSLLNITGLAVGLAAGILVLLWIGEDLRYNRFHDRLPNLHLILNNQTQGGVTYTHEALPGPLAATLLAEIPEIKRAVRFSWTGEQLLAVGEKAFYEKGLYAEPDFFNILSFPAVKGNPAAALQDAGSVVLSERAARKLFGDQDPIGQTLRHDNLRTLTVAAVVRDVPTASTLQFDVVLPFRIYEQDNQDWIHTWENNSLPTWVELQPGTDLAALNTKLHNFIQRKSADAISHIFAYPLADKHLYGRFQNGKPSGGRVYALVALGIVGLFIVLLACLNFMNLATAQSERRAREVGVRKAIGARSSLIVGQFLSEALLTAFLGLGLGLGLAKLILPAFNQVSDKHLAIDLGSGALWAGLIILGLATGLVAGSYPAFYLSRFQPAKVLSGQAIGGGRRLGIFRKALVTVQFFVSILLVICTIVIYRQLDYGQKRPLGFDKENLIRIPAQGSMAQHLDLLKTDLLRLPGVRSVSASNNNLLRCGSNTSGISWPGMEPDQDFRISVTLASYDWAKTMGIRVLEGREFSPEFGSDSSACLLNQSAVRRMRLEHPVGTMLDQGRPIQVIGVLEDYVYNDPFSNPEPMIVFLNTGELSSFYVRFDNDGQWQERLAGIEKAVKATNPGYPFEFEFTKEEVHQSYTGARSSGQMASVFGGLAILISCLGLFGLSAFIAERRKKEMSIRKVLGASTLRVWYLLSNEFTRPVLLAFVLAAPLAGWLMQQLLSNFEYRIDLAWWMFALAGVLALLVAVLTVSVQGIRAALVNPVEALRKE
ncbi:MAG: ABC transporter permease [Saprospiraceae bacterium]|nr:ABC transporter permease [Saprospiraceae bacterium]